LTAEYVLTVHDELSGLGDDDHVQYALANKTRPTPWVSAADLSGLSIADLGTKDHDLLDGLGDDDHVQYLLINGTRAMTGALNMGTNPIDNVTHLRNVGSTLDFGGTVADPHWRNIDEWESNFWPTGKTIVANQNPVINYQGSDTVNYASAVFPSFINLNRVVTAQQSFNAFLMHYAYNNSMEFQNANAVAANLGLIIGLDDQPLQRADGAVITSVGYAGFFSNPRFQAINAGSLAVTYIINNYLTANLGASTAVTFFIHNWIVNPGGAGAAVNEYGMWIQDLTKAVNAYGIYSQLQAGATKWFLFQTAGGAKIQLTGDLGFFGTAPAAQQTVTGSRGGNVALASLLTALATYGLIIDNTTV
jgi:hypothetical protein